MGGGGLVCGSAVCRLSDSCKRRRYGWHLLICEGAHIESDQIVFDPAEHTKMVCVESGNVKKNKISLAPGKTTTLKVIITSRRTGK